MDSYCLCTSQQYETYHSQDKFSNCHVMRWWLQSGWEINSCHRYMEALGTFHMQNNDLLFSCR